MTKNFSLENRDVKETMWKITVAYCKVWLGAEELLIKDQILRNCPSEPLRITEYVACR